MRIKNKFIIYLFSLHLIFLVLILLLLKTEPLFFVLGEITLLISLVIGLILLFQYSKPIDSLSQGLENLKDKDFSMKLLPTRHEDTDQLVTVYNKMIDQLRSERLKQRETNYFLEKLMQASPAGIIILDYEDRISTINPAILTISGLEEEQMLQKSLTEIVHPLLNQLQALEERETIIIEITAYETFQCSKASFIDKGHKHYFIIIEPLKDALITAERKAYGKIIRLMTHELNNTVGAVNSILESLLSFEDMITDPMQAQYSKIIKVAIQRNDHLNEFMGGFANIIRIPKPNIKKLDLNALLQNQILLMEGYIGSKDINITSNFSQKSCFVNADESQMEQVVFNILKNAVEAIEEKGKLIIETSKSDSVQLKISNNGTPIPPEIESQLFTPFFSSKKNGQGLGLTLIREVLTNHGFSFNLSTSTDGLTIFEINM